MYQWWWGGCSSRAGGWGWGGRPGKWQLGVVVEHPTTQNIIGKAKTVQSEEWGEGKEPHIQHVKLYLSSLTDNETSAPPDSPNSDIQQYNCSVSTSSNQICTQYSWFDSGASHCSPNTAYNNSLRLKHPLCEHMWICVAGEGIAEEDNWQV